MNEDPYRTPAAVTTKRNRSFSVRHYWNSILSLTALLLHCAVFAAIEFNIEAADSIFPFAPLELILMIFCFVASLVQAVTLIFSRTPSKHRLFAIGLTWLVIGAYFITGEFGWFIHV